MHLTYGGGSPRHAPPGAAVVLVQVVKGTLIVARSPAGLRASHAASVAIAQDST